MNKETVLYEVSPPVFTKPYQLEVIDNVQLTPTYLGDKRVPVRFPPIEKPVNNKVLFVEPVRSFEVTRPVSYRPVEVVPSSPVRTIEIAQPAPITTFELFKPPPVINSFKASPVVQPAPVKTNRLYPVDPPSVVTPRRAQRSARGAEVGIEINFWL